MADGAETPALVKVGAARTYNLGNYESLRVEVHIEYPCAADSVQEVFKELATKLPRRIERVKDLFVTDES